MTCVYIYRLTADTGLAPCVKKGLLSLAVCKGGQIRGNKIIHTGLRYWVGSKKDADYTHDNVYILGTYENKLLYFARVTQVVTMMKYFDGMSEGRTDAIYSMVRGELARNKHLLKENVHIEPERIAKDFAGEYVLLSDDYIYLGQEAVPNDVVARYTAKFQETKRYEGDIAEIIVSECRKYADGKKHTPHSPFQKIGGCK